MTEESSTNRYLLLGLPALGLLLVAAYFFWPGEDSPGLQEIYAPEGPGPEVGVEPPVAPAVQETKPKTGDVEVFVQMEVLARALPPRPPRPQCFLVARPGDRGVPGTWVAGLATLPFARAITGQQLVRFDLGAAGGPHYRITRLVPRDTGRIELLRGPNYGLRGKVVDASGKPLRGASIWLAGAETETSAEGTFEIPALPADSGLPLVVRLRGRQTHFEVLTGAGFSRREQEPIVLREGVALHVRGAGAVGPEAECVLLPVGGRETRLLRTPFFWAALGRPSVLDEGVLVLDGLPLGASFRIRLRQPGRVTTWSRKTQLTRPSQIVTVAGVAMPQLSGSVVDGTGASVTHAWITARPGDEGLSLRDTDWLLPPAGYVASGEVTRANPDGKFAIARPKDGQQRTLVTVEAEGFAGLEYALDAQDPATLNVQLFAERERGEPRLTLRAEELPGRVKLRVKDDHRSLGPYGWDTSRPFPLRVSRGSLLRVTTRVGSAAARSEVVLVVGETVAVVRGG